MSLLTFSAQLDAKKTLDKLEGLPRRLKKKYMRRSARKATTPRARDLRKRLPRKGDTTTGTLKKNIRVKVKQYTSGENVTVWAAAGARKYRVETPLGVRNPINYLHLVEGGANPHRIAGLLRFTANGQVIYSRGVRHPGSPAQRPIAKASSATETEAVIIFGRDIDQQLQTERATS